jgi:L-lactate dehydrogenase complex protein LldF
VSSDGRYDYNGSFGGRALVSLDNVGMRKTLATAVDRQAAGRRAGMATLEDPEGLRDLGARIREHNLAHLDEHLERLAQTWQEAGGKVFFAADAAEASAYSLDVARRVDAQHAVKVKSMVTEEIDLNRVLSEAGIDPVETDLGQYIVQLAGEPPSHIVAPAIHKSKPEVTELFSALAGERLPDDASALTAFARERLRKLFLSAGVGFSGVNFGVADAGTLCLVTNEGNGRLTSSLPRAHVAIMGMERVVWDFEQLSVLLCLLARGNTGQKITQYTSLLHGPRRADESDGPDEAHLVILDNGRSRLLGTRYQSALRCIRCGGCLNVCPVFRQVGGYAYDPVYSGPIGAVITPLLKGVEAAGDLAHASTLCGACTDVCPVRIPLHDLLLYVRQDHAQRAAGPAERSAYGLWSRAWASPRRFAPFVRATQLLARLRGGRSLRRLPVPLLARWMRGRSLPLAGSDGAPSSPARGRAEVR